jgi:hypothetical protein
MSLILDGTNGLSDVDGSAATPAIRGSDANTGVFFGTDIVGVSTGGSERVRVDASGNVGIGTSSPLSPLDVVVGAGGARRVLVNYDDSIITIKGASNTADPETLRFVADNIRFNTGTTGSGTERARILSTGQFLVNGTTNRADGRFEVAGNSDSTFNPMAVVQEAAGSTSRTSINFYRVSASASVGVITTTNTSTAYVTSSDYRLKHDIAPITGALARVSLLKPVTYKWNIDDRPDEGFIAHELQEVFPQAVSGEKDAVETYTDENGVEQTRPVYQGIDTSFLVATLAAAIQELKGINDAQAQIITALTARVEALEGAQA